MKQIEQKVIEFDAVCQKISKGKSGVDFEIRNNDEGIDRYIKTTLEEEFVKFSRELTKVILENQSEFTRATYDQIQKAIEKVEIARGSFKGKTPAYSGDWQDIDSPVEWEIQNHLKYFFEEHYKEIVDYYRKLIVHEFNENEKTEQLLFREERESGINIIKVKTNNLQIEKKNKSLKKFIKSDFFEFAFIKGGKFFMGTYNENNEKPVHEVRVDDFYIGKYLVTQKLWQEITGNNKLSYHKKCNNCPVEQVSFNGVEFFLEKLNERTELNFRLPTETEWEYAAGGGQNTPLGKSIESGAYYPQIYAGTDLEKELEDYAWYFKNAENKTHPVGEKLANPLGLFDMSGNVWEWCSSKFELYEGNFRSYLSRAKSQVIRGGGCKSGANFCRIASRNHMEKSDKNSYLGFRIAIGI